MDTIYIEGGIPLTGTVYMSGAKNSALKLIHVAMFSNEDIILMNVPRIGNITVDLEIITQMGGKAEWLGNNRLLLNGSGLHTFEIPQELGAKYRTASLLAAPLLYRFGKAIVPKPGGCKIGPRPINRWVETWENLGISVTETDNSYILESKSVEGCDINFKVKTHMGTDNAILSSLFSKGVTTINNAAEEVEVDDLIDFCNLIGGNVKRLAPDRIQVTGAQAFKGAVFSVQNDRNEAVTFAIAAYLTKGDLTISGVNKGHLLSFCNTLNKIGCKYEFSKNDMKVWYSGEEYLGTNITTSPAPGFMTDWQSLITLLLTQAKGESLVYDTVYTDRFGYTKDLNKMGADIELLQPSTLDLDLVISDDAYDISSKGEPFCVAKVTGPTKLKSSKLVVPDLRAGATFVLAGLAAEGTTELSGYENISRGYENFVDKLISLGAHINS